jgi:hypothetical protein
MDNADGGSVGRVQFLRFVLTVLSHSGFNHSGRVDWCGSNGPARVQSGTVISGSGAGSILPLTFVGRWRYVLVATIRAKSGEFALVGWKPRELQLSVTAVACDVMTPDDWPN